MNRRFLPLLVLASLFVGSLAVEFLVPALSTYLTFGFLFLLIASFILFRIPTAPGPSVGGGGAAATSGGSLPALPPVRLSFCAFCGSDLSDGAVSCPACQHAVLPI